MYLKQKESEFSDSFENQYIFELIRLLISDYKTSVLNISVLTDNLNKI
jgi:hypothetical protein